MSKTSVLGIIFYAVLQQSEKQHFHKKVCLANFQTRFFINRKKILFNYHYKIGNPFFVVFFCEYLVFLENCCNQCFLRNSTIFLQ